MAVFRGGSNERKCRKRSLEDKFGRIIWKINSETTLLRNNRKTITKRKTFGRDNRKKFQKMILKTKNEIETRRPAMLNSEKKLGREILYKKSENCFGVC